MAGIFVRTFHSTAEQQLAHCRHVIIMADYKQLMEAGCLVALCLQIYLLQDSKGSERDNKLTLLHRTQHIKVIQKCFEKVSSVHDNATCMDILFPAPPSTC